MRLILTLFACVLLSSCYVTTYTHSEVMNETVMGATKEEVIANLGLPDQKQTEGEYDQWVFHGGTVTRTYNHPSRTITTGSAATGSRNIYGETSSVNVNANTWSFGGGSTTRSYNRYIKLLFKNDIVIDWDTQGCNFSEKRSTTGGVILGVLGTGVAVAATIIAAGM